jgi:hypothetical protein
MFSSKLLVYHLFLRQNRYYFTKMNTKIEKIFKSGAFSHYLKTKIVFFFILEIKLL